MSEKYTTVNIKAPPGPPTIKVSVTYEEAMRMNGLEPNPAGYLAQLVEEKNGRFVLKLLESGLYDQQDKAVPQ